MSTVLRVFWLFYTAFPVQRLLAAVGGAIAACVIVAGLVFSGPPEVYGAAALVVTVFVPLPAVFAGAALFRAMSAPRSHQLWPYQRTRMLTAVALLIASLVLWFGGLLAASAAFLFDGGRAVQITVLVYPFAFVTAVFVGVWLFSADWRWAFAFLLLPPGFIMLVRTPSGGPEAGPPPVAAVLVATLLVWAVFAAWYLRVRRVRPLMLAPAVRGEVSAWSGALTRDAAIRSTLAWNGQPGVLRVVSGSGVVSLAVLVVFVLVAGANNPSPSLASFIWPFVSMAMVGGAVGLVARQSKLLWLKIEGGRDGVRLQVERAAAFHGLATLAIVMTGALILTDAFDASPRDLTVGFAVCVSAAVYGAYVALAALPGLWTQTLGFGLMTLLQLALLARAAPTVTSVAIVIAVQLGGAAVFRVLAVRRWRSIDWRLFPPKRSMPGVP